METHEITMLIAAIAAGIAGWSLISSKNSVRISEKALKNSEKSNSAIIELGVFNNIRATRERCENIILQMTPLTSKENRTEEEEKQLNAHKGVYESSKEEYLNAYEGACALYLDEKLDTVRFKKDYQTSIRNLVEKPPLDKEFSGTKKKYEAILKVYNKWETKE